MPLRVTQSASRTKKALGCSWQYHAAYILKIPDSSNDGARLGDCAHIILECLAPEKRKKYVSKILKKNDIFCIQSVKHLAYKLIHRHSLDSEVFILKLKEFVLNGLRSDFYGLARGKPIATYTEREFLIEKPEKYKVRGFIDRLFVYKDGTVVVRDYKSSKEAYKGHESSSENIQASDYALAVREIVKDVLVKKIIVEFLFLKFDCTKESVWSPKIYRGKQTKELEHNGGGKITIEFSPEEISGFEHELESYQKYLENFTEKTAQENFAADQGMPNDGSFSGKLLCGMGTVEGELKKDGTPKFACAAKFAFNYYHIFDAENNFVATCFLHEREKLEAKYPPANYNWQEKSYSGCPKFRKRS